MGPATPGLGGEQRFRCTSSRGPMSQDLQDCSDWALEDVVPHHTVARPVPYETAVKSEVARPY